MKKIILSAAINLFPQFNNFAVKRFLLKTIMKLDDKQKTNTRKLMKKHYNTTIGKYSYGCFDVDYTIEPGTTIGSFCSIAPGVKIGNMNHPIKFLSTHPFLYEKKYGFIPETDEKLKSELTKKVTIESDVWIGLNAVIMPGITVGKGAIIGAGAVVTKDVEPYTIVGGIPAKTIKKRFSEEVIKELIKIDWENWDDNKIKNHVSQFYEPEKLIKIKNTSQTA